MNELNIYHTSFLPSREDTYKNPVYDKSGNLIKATKCCTKEDITPGHKDWDSAVEFIKIGYPEDISEKTE